MFDPRAPLEVRAGLVLGATLLTSLIAATLYRRRNLVREYWRHAQATGTSGLWVAACLLVVARQFELPGVEPEGYWPRCAMNLGLLAFNLAMVVELAPVLRSTRRLFCAIPLLVAAWVALVAAAVAVTWYHRPLAR